MSTAASHIINREHRCDRCGRQIPQVTKDEKIVRLTVGQRIGIIEATRWSSEISYITGEHDSNPLCKPVVPEIEPEVEALGVS